MSGDPALRGHFESISRGITDPDNSNGPELLANISPTFEWVRLAQRIPVRIHIDEIPPSVLVSSGMTCTVQVAAPPRLGDRRAVARTEVGHLKSGAFKISPRPICPRPRFYI
jgi:multidrug resistance efflux pump